jgi:hypothetical protein
MKPFANRQGSRFQDGLTDRERAVFLGSLLKTQALLRMA